MRTGQFEYMTGNVKCNAMLTPMCIYHRSFGDQECNSPPTLTGVGHQQTVNTIIGCN